MEARADVFERDGELVARDFMRDVAHGVAHGEEGLHGHPISLVGTTRFITTDARMFRGDVETSHREHLVLTIVHFHPAAADAVFFLMHAMLLLLLLPRACALR